MIKFENVMIVKDRILMNAQFALFQERSIFKMVSARFLSGLFCALAVNHSVSVNAAVDWPREVSLVKLFPPGGQTVLVLNLLAFH